MNKMINTFGANTAHRHINDEIIEEFHDRVEPIDYIDYIDVYEWSPEYESGYGPHWGDMIDDFDEDDFRDLNSPREYDLEYDYPYE